MLWSEMFGGSPNWKKMYERRTPKDCQWWIRMKQEEKKRARNEANVNFDKTCTRTSERVSIWSISIATLQFCSNVVTFNFSHSLYSQGPNFLSRYSLIPFSLHPDNPFPVTQGPWGTEINVRKRQKRVDYFERFLRKSSKENGKIVYFRDKRRD